MTVTKAGDTVILLPKCSKWTGFLDSLELFSDDFMRDEQTRRSL